MAIKKMIVINDTIIEIFSKAALRHPGIVKNYTWGRADRGGPKGGVGGTRHKEGPKGRKGSMRAHSGLAEGREHPVRSIQMEGFAAVDFRASLDFCDTPERKISMEQKEQKLTGPAHCQSTFIVY